MKDNSFKSNRLHFRPFQQDDLSAVRELMSDAETMKYTSYERAQGEDKIREALGKWIDDGGKGVWAVQLNQSSKVVGWCMLKLTTFECPELGYMVNRKYCGQGFATEIALATIKHGFEHLKHTLVMARVRVENPPSIRVLEKSGFKISDKYSSLETPNLIYFECTKSL
ncbi:MAG: GNAT family N-acetyltransferase [Bdellovibrionales bacterium]|nr:GNAT family N-acetyltransferase [Bdellovibrionales bacterium]